MYTSCSVIDTCTLRFETCMSDGSGILNLTKNNLLRPYFRIISLCNHRYDACENFTIVHVHGHVVTRRCMNASKVSFP